MELKNKNMILVYLLIMAITLLYIATALVSLILRVPYVPTKKRVMHKILNEINPKEGATFMDLGCGDARMLVEAEKKHKVKAIGYEIAPLIYLLGYFRKLLSKSKVKLYFRNFLNESLENADIIFCYLMPRQLEQVAIKAKKECKKGTQIISNTFKIKGLKPHKIIKKNEESKTPSLYFYKI